MKKKDETRGGPVVSEAMGNIRTVAAFTLQNDMCERYEKDLQMEVQEDRRQNITQGLMQAYALLVQPMIFGLTVLISAYYVSWGWVEVSAVFPVLYTLMST